MNSPLDADIPTLTEIISVPLIENAAGAPLPLSGLKAPETESKEPDVSESPTIGTWGDEERNRLERKLRERILRQILGRIDFVLEQRIRDSLENTLQSAVLDLTKEIKRGLHQTLDDVISRAVSQEIARLQTRK